MSQLNTLTFIDIKELAKAVGNEVTYMIEGEPGIGKTTIGRTLADELGFGYSYLDMANTSLGDMSMPVVNREAHCTQYYPNEVLGLHTGKPIVLVLDEWTKAGKEAKNMTLPLVEERRLGSTKLHPESIVLATGNMSNEGLGDTIQAHQADRFVVVEMRKPNAEEWLGWAATADIDPVVMAFVDQYPQVLQSYKEDPHGTNDYIFNPKKQQKKVVTPRSLEKASKQLRKAKGCSPVALQLALSGTIGRAAAADLSAFVTMNDQLTPFNAIVANPLGAALPSGAAPAILQLYNMLMRVEKDTLRPVLKYVERLDSELIALFLNKVLSTPSKASFSTQHPDMSPLLRKYMSMFTV